MAIKTIGRCILVMYLGCSGSAQESRVDTDSPPVGLVFASQWDTGLGSDDSAIRDTNRARHWHSSSVLNDILEDRRT